MLYTAFVRQNEKHPERYGRCQEQRQQLQQSHQDDGKHLRKQPVAGLVIAGMLKGLAVHSHDVPSGAAHNKVWGREEICLTRAC